MLTAEEIKKSIVLLPEKEYRKLRKWFSERDIALVQREPFDYTEWQRTLWEDQSVEEISKAAMRLSENTAEQHDSMG